MAKRRFLLELRYSKNLAANAFAMADSLDTAAVPKIPSVKLDTSFAPVPLPGQGPREQSVDPFDRIALFDLLMQPDESTYVVRVEADEDDVDEISGTRAVVGVFSDPDIHVFQDPPTICPGSPPLGTDGDVESLLCVPSLHSAGMDGNGVLVAIVDSGINTAHLVANGKTPNLDVARSWVPTAGLVPGSAPVGHGTMCAYDALIAAPKATLLDIQLLQSTAGGPTPMSGVLSDAIRAYRHLIDVMAAPQQPGEARSLVVNNSWGMFHETWDFPVGHPGNYSDNPNHPFNRIVAELERAGADILFAAGNCGEDCPDGRCRGVTANAIYGANGHASVMCVAGVDTLKRRVGYSTIGPGRLTRDKPDISGYTHFRGSGVYAADGGTSAATPVVAGVVAAVRSVRPFNDANPSTHPAAIRSLLTSTAEDLGPVGYDFRHGYGVVDGCALRKKLRPWERILPPRNLCERYPWLCRPVPIDLCERFPRLCNPLPPVPDPPFPPPPFRRVPPPGLGADAGSDAPSADVAGLDPGVAEDPIAMSYIQGYLDGSKASGQAVDDEC
jgi:hypothetical protein